MQPNQDLPLRPMRAAHQDRCPAAHVLDPRPCEGAPDAVQIVDRAGAAAPACLLHGAVLLASLDRARVYPLSGRESCAITVYTRARTLPPLDFLTGPRVERVTTAGGGGGLPGWVGYG